MTNLTMKCIHGVHDMNGKIWCMYCRKDVDAKTIMAHYKSHVDTMTYDVKETSKEKYGWLKSKIKKRI